MKKYNYNEVLKCIRPNGCISLLDNKLAVFFVYLLQRLPLNPNLLTFFSFSFFLISLLFLFYNLKILFAVMLFLSYTFDNIDGIWARLHNQTSIMGAWLDSTFDRIKDAFIFIILIFVFDGILKIIFILCIFFYLLFLNLTLNSKTYLNLDSFKKNKSEKNFLSYGPAELYLIFFLIIALPSNYKIFPASLLLIIQIVISFKELYNSFIFLDSNAKK